jgi:Type IV pilin-like G and H, putative
MNQLWFSHKLRLLGFSSLAGLLILFLWARVANHPNKCCAHSGRSGLGTIMRTQQASLLDRGYFAKSIDALNLKLDPRETAQYRFQMEFTHEHSILVSAIDRRSGWHKFIGRVDAIKDAKGNFRSQALICEVINPSAQFVPRLSNTKTCIPGTRKHD